MAAMRPPEMGLVSSQESLTNSTVNSYGNTFGHSVMYHSVWAMLIHLHVIMFESA